MILLGVLQAPNITLEHGQIFGQYTITIVTWFVVY